MEAHDESSMIFVGWRSGAEGPSYVVVGGWDRRGHMLPFDRPRVK
jgi:hypothetical protein